MIVKYYSPVNIYKYMKDRMDGRKSKVNVQGDNKPALKQWKSTISATAVRKSSHSSLTRVIYRSPLFAERKQRAGSIYCYSMSRHIRFIKVLFHIFALSRGWNNPK